jgi:uncharacterized FlaG/YvyC family protein
MKKLTNRNFGFLTLTILLFIFQSCKSEQGTSSSSEGLQENQGTELLNDKESNRSETDAASAVSADGQQKLSDKELEEFSKLNNEMRAVRNHLTEDLRKYVADQGYTMEEYQQLSRTPESDLSAEEKEAVRKIDERMTVFQQDVRFEMEKMVTAAGYTLEEFLQVGRVISRDAEMRAKVERNNN